MSEPLLDIDWIQIGVSPRMMHVSLFPVRKAAPNGETVHHQSHILLLARFSMPEYYLDFETEGVNPEEHKIITIQFQKLETETGKPLSDLTILKEWESTERDILKRFLVLMPPGKSWKFIPIGFNLRFEFRFLRCRANKVLNLDLDDKWLYYELPHVDIKHTLVMMNRGRIKGTTLDWFVKKQKDQTKVPSWYTSKEYNAIEEYIRDEAKRFIHGYKFLKTELPMIYQKYDPLL